MTTLVSVVVPARNEADCIETALTSVFAQRYPRDSTECVVVDNGSVDGTRDAAQGWSRRHQALRVLLVLEPVAGVAGAKNRGAESANGEILVFLDADSRMSSSLIADVAAAHDAGYSAGSIRIIADGGDALERVFFALMEVGKVFFGVRAQMMYCDRSLFLALGGFRPELRQAEDLEFLQRVAAHAALTGGRVCHIRSSTIATSTRRLRGGRFRHKLLFTFVRWLLAFAGWGREREY